MGRPIEFNRENAIQCAMKVFWVQGYEKTSLTDLIQEMGLSKSSFYQSFGSKRGLFKLCLDKYKGDFIKKASRILDKSPSGKVFINTFFKELIDKPSNHIANRGCFIVNTAIEFKKKDKNIAIFVNQSMKELQGVFQKAIDESKQKGELPQFPKSNILAGKLVMIFFGSKIMFRVGMERSLIRKIVFYSIENLFVA